TLAELAGALDGGALTSTAGPRVSLTPVVPDDEVIALLVEAAADRTIQIATELPWNLDHDAARRYAAEADGVVIRVDGRAAGAAFIQLHPNIGDGVEVPPGAVQLDEWLLAPYRDLGLLGAAGAWPLLRAWMAERFRHEVSVVWEDHTTMITILRARGYRRLGRVWWRSASDGDGTEGPCEVWLYDLRG
ncbi:MAG TPA: hypothetical protein PKA64_24520, partial [Myxococcota bacterium]|nr:hypothetical protein [Myxococcota bacterium]